MAPKNMYGGVHIFGDIIYLKLHQLELDFFMFTNIKGGEWARIIKYWNDIQKNKQKNKQSVTTGEKQ